jgi:hypothetical protein
MEKVELSTHPVLFRQMPTGKVVIGERLKHKYIHEMVCVQANSVHRSRRWKRRDSPLARRRRENAFGCIRDA